MTVSRMVAGAMIVAIAGLASCTTTRRVSGPVEIFRPSVVTMKGKPITLEGTGRAVVGRPAPDFAAVANDMGEKRLVDWRGKVVILSTVPSLETAVCDRETREFNERASALGDGFVVLTVSMDLPFAQKRWCGAAGVDRVITLSDSKRREVGDRYGVRIRENGLLARTVTVIDADGVVRYQEIVPEVASEPNYDAVIEAATSAAAPTASRQ